MKYHTLTRLTLSVSLVTSLLLISGCNDDDGSGVGAQNAPAGVAGVGFAFNPTVTFTDGTNFQWENDEVGTPFPAGPFTGTYTYTRDSDSQATIDLTAAEFTGGTLTLVLSGFVGTDAAITGFDVLVDGSTFSADIVEGTLVPQSSGGGGGIPSGVDTSPATVPTTLVGSYSLEYAFEANPGGPFTLGQMVDVMIGSDNTLSIDGQVLTDPVFLNGNEQEVNWYDGEYVYGVSGPDGFNEINVGRGFPGEQGFLFLGQLQDTSGR